MSSNHSSYIQDLNLHETRELNQMGLLTFHFGQENDFEYQAEKVIEHLKEKDKEDIIKHDELVAIKEHDPERWKEIKEDADRNDINLDYQLNDYYIDSIYRQDEIRAFQEMKIIYAFKHLEIILKRLLHSAYPESINNDFRNWDSFTDFCKTKSIALQQLQGYNEIQQLRQVNNALKHNGEVTDKIAKYPEFAKGQDFSAENLGEFYLRIKPFPKFFIKSLISAIHDELYKFDEERIRQLVISYVLRMDKDTALWFGQMLIGSY